MPRNEALENLKKVYSRQNVVPDPTTSGPEQKQPPPQETPLSLLEKRLARIEETLLELMTSIIAGQEQIAARQEQIDRNLAEFVKVVTDGGGEDRSFYSTAEFAAKVGKKDRTVQRWCREVRINAKKRPSGRGEHGEYMISRAELNRYLNFGLLPVPKD